MNERDQALEHLFQNTLIMIDNVLRETFSAWVHLCLMAHSKASHSNSAHTDLLTIQHLDQQMGMIGSQCSSQILRLVQSLRAHTYVLTVTSETEAIARATGKKAHYNVTKEDVDKAIYRKTWGNQDLDRVILMGLVNIRDRLKKVAHWLLLNPEVSERDAARMLLAKLPKTRPLAKKKRVLKPMHMFEADRTKGEDMSSGFISEEDWDDMLDQYLTDNIRVNRGPEAVFPATDAKSDLKTLGGEEVEQVPHYAWEIEQEVTQDFVYQVRDGQIAAAKKQGFTDFIWIAVVDSKTDECCLWRDGLTTKEIESQLSKHDDDCDGAIVPPGHPNCRCTLAPATDDLPDIPESNESEFDQWINS